LENVERGKRIKVFNLPKLAAREKVFNWLSLQKTNKKPKNPGGYQPSGVQELFIRNLQAMAGGSRSGHRPISNWLSSCLVAMCLALPGGAPAPQESPAYYYVGCYTARTDLLHESVYSKTPQTCIEICEHQGHLYAVLASEKCFCANILEPQEQQDEQLCNTRCLANKAQYCGGVGVHSYYSTTLTKQPAPHHLRISNKTENSLTLNWDAYEARKFLLAGGAEAVLPNQLLDNFLIRAEVLRTYSSLPAFPQPEFMVQKTETQFELTDLHPATLYNISVRAICQDPQAGQSECGQASIEANTQVGTAEIPH